MWVSRVSFLGMVIFNQLQGHLNINVCLIMDWGETIWDDHNKVATTKDASNKTYFIWWFNHIMESPFPDQTRNFRMKTPPPSACIFFASNFPNEFYRTPPSRSLVYLLRPLSRGTYLSLSLLYCTLFCLNFVSTYVPTPIQCTR